MTKCSKCDRTIKDGELRLNAPTGVRCLECSDKVNICGREVSYDLLEEYRKCVRHCRRAIIHGIGAGEPQVIINSIANREKLHRRIFKEAGLRYPSENHISKRAVEFNKKLELFLR